MSSMKFKKQLLLFFSKQYSPGTSRLYTKWIVDLIKYHKKMYGDWIKPDEMGQHHIDEFLAWMVRPAEYSRSSYNQATRAIKVYFEHIGNPMHVKQYSTRHYLKRPYVLTGEQIRNIIDNLGGQYSIIVREIYENPGLKTSDILSNHYSHNSTVHPRTVNKKLRAACDKLGYIQESVTITTIRRAAIVHLLQDGKDWRELDWLSETTMKQVYIPLATK